MSKIKQLLYVLLLVPAFIFTACSTNSGLAKDVYATPEDIVLEIGVNQLVKKSNFLKTHTPAEVENLLDNAGNDNMRVLLKSLLHPKNSPLNLDSKIYTVTNPKGDTAILHFKVKDATSLEARCIEMANNNSNTFEMAEQGDFKLFHINDMSTVAYSKNRGFIFDTETVSPELLALLINPQEQNLSQLAYKDLLNKEANDFLVVGTNKSLVTIYQELYRKFFFMNMPEMALDNELSKVYQAYTLSFNKGNITTNVEMIFPTEEVKNNFNENIAAGKLSNNLMSYISEKDLFVFYVNLIGKKVLDAPQFEEVLKNLSQLGIDSNHVALEKGKELLALIDGDIAFTIKDITPSMFNMTVDYLAMVDKNGAAIFNKTKELFQVMNVPTQDLGDAMFSIYEGGITSFFGHKDDILFVSNQIEALDEFNKVNPDLTKARFYSGSQDYGLFTLDLNSLIQKNEIQAILGFINPNQANLINQLDYLKIEIPSTSKAEAKIALKDKNKNSLELIVESLFN